MFSGVSSPPPVPPPPRPPTPAEAWLANQLRTGPRLKSDIDTAEKASGISGVKAASRSLGVAVTEPRTGCWFWALPVGFDWTPYPAPPEPPAPTLVDDIEPPATAPEVKPKAKRPRGKAATRPAAGHGPPSVEQVAVMLREAKRSWADVAAHLDEQGEYYPADLELHGLTEKQLQQVVDWLAAAN